MKKVKVLVNKKYVVSPTRQFTNLTWKYIDEKEKWLKQYRNGEAAKDIHRSDSLWFRELLVRDDVFRNRIGIYFDFGHLRRLLLVLARPPLTAFLVGTLMLLVLNDCMLRGCGPHRPPNKVKCMDNEDEVNCCAVKLQIWQLYLYEHRATMLALFCGAIL